jgi:hypothetical protein
MEMCCYDEDMCRKMSVLLVLLEQLTLTFWYVLCTAEKKSYMSRIEEKGLFVRILSDRSDGHGTCRSER